MRTWSPASPSALALCLLGLLGCGEPQCPSGETFADGLCAPDDAGTDASIADAGACAMECTGATPVCDEASGACVECVAASDCPAETPLCETQTCVACATNVECTTPTASRCDANECAACQSAVDCAHLTGTPVCDAGECVECTTNADCGGNVCHLDARTCTDVPPRSLHACQPCVHDEQCQEGQLCIETVYATPPPERGVGTYCLWRRDATAVGAPNGECGLGSQPYARPRNVTSIDGVTADVCELRTTTCAALLHHATAVPGCDAAGDDDACGVTSFSDGRCRLIGSQPRCTYPCLGTEDCRPGSTCPETGDQFCSI